MYNVKDYGAIGNGTTDDTAAITAAITAVDSGRGGVVYFPAGVYRVTNTITVNKNNVTLRGDGLSSQIDLRISGTTRKDGIAFRKTSAAEVAAPGIEDLFIYAHTNVQAAIAIQNTSRFMARNLQLWSATQNAALVAIEVYKGSVAYNTNFRDVFIGDNFDIALRLGQLGSGLLQNVDLRGFYIGNNNVGVYIKHVGGFKWEGGEILNCTNSFVVEQSGLAERVGGLQISKVFFDTPDNLNVAIRVLSGTTGDIHHVTFTDCSFNWNQNANEASVVLNNDSNEPRALRNIKFIGCEFSINKGSSMYIRNAHHVDLIGNHFVNSGQVGQERTQVLLDGNSNGIKFNGGYFGNSPENSRSNYGISKSDSVKNVRIIGVEFVGHTASNLHPSMYTSDVVRLGNIGD